MHNMESNRQLSPWAARKILRFHLEWHKKFSDFDENWFSWGFWRNYECGLKILKFDLANQFFPFLFRDFEWRFVTSDLENSRVQIFIGFK